MEPIYWEPIVQVRNRQIIMYDRWIGPRGSKEKSLARVENVKKQKKKAYGSHLSKGAKKRMTRAISTLCRATGKRNVFNPILNRKVPHTLSFLTLTVSDSTINYTSREVYQTCLRPFLQWLTKTHGVRLYLWVAEQQKRGQIHYHLTFPEWIHYQEIKNKWNYLQLKAGYLEGFKAKYGHIEPNSVDIHSTRKIKDMAAYLSKYLSKGQEAKPSPVKANGIAVPEMNGKLWDCAALLKTTSYFEALHCTTIEALIKEAIAAGKAILEQFERFAIVSLKRGSITDLLPLSDLFNFKSYYKAVYVEAYSTKPPV